MIPRYLTGRDLKAAELAALASAKDFRRRLRRSGTLLAKSQAVWCRSRQRWRAKVIGKGEPRPLQTGIL